MKILHSGDGHHHLGGEGHHHNHENGQQHSHDHRRSEIQPSGHKKQYGGMANKELMEGLIDKTQSH